MIFLDLDSSQVSRSTLTDANEVRDWCIYAGFALSIIGIARCLYAGEPFGLLSRGDASTSVRKGISTY